MIDINELRRLALDGDLAAMQEIILRLEAAEKERDFAKAEIARLHDDTHELTDERGTYKAACNEWIAKPDKWIAKTEWAQDELTRGKLPAKYLGMPRADGIKVELDALRAALQHEADCVEAAKAEIEALRAKIEAIEKQEPVATVIKEGDSRYWMSERLWTFPDGKYPLYALPGAQPAPSVPDDVMRDAKRYRFLRAAKNIPISTEAARDPIVYDAAIDAAMLAAAPEAKP